MVPLTDRIPAATWPRLRVPRRRQTLTPDEQKAQEVRRRLLRYLVQTHYRREAERARGLNALRGER